MNTAVGRGWDVSVQNPPTHADRSKQSSGERRMKRFRSDGVGPRLLQSLLGPIFYTGVMVGGRVSQIKKALAALEHFSIFRPFASNAFERVHLLDTSPGASQMLPTAHFLGSKAGHSWL